MAKQVSYVPIEPYLVSKITNMVTHLLATKLYYEFIKIPFSRRRIIEMTQAFEELTSLPNMCGAIDGSPIKLHRLPNDQNLTGNYKCRYGYPSVLLQDVKAPSGTDDATHFWDSLLHNQLASGDIVWEKVINGMGTPAQNLMKGRYVVILQDLNMGLNHAPQTIVACCMLHNIGSPPRVPDNKKSFYYFGENLRQALIDDLH
ncbi:hypothetical protein UlMin_014792 [Ulmus minor]